jgi:N-acetylglucosamine-6-phosphate deacetylase
MPKLDNTLFAQLAEDRLSASFIADGIHLPPQALKTLLRAKGADRSILVTDAISAAAGALGLHPFAGMSVEHAPDGSARLPGTKSLAGSALTLDRAVRNVVDWGFATPEQSLSMAADSPRRLMAPALAAHSVELDPGEVDWSPGLFAGEVRVGPVRWVP